MIRKTMTVLALGLAMSAGAAWTTKQAKEAHHVAEDHPMGLALGAFALGLGLGFLISRNLAR